MINYSMLPDQDELKAYLEQLEAQSVIQRIWDHDHTVWSPDPDEITNRLGWMDVPMLMDQALTELGALSEAIRREGVDEVVLLGMGGSSLAPDVFQRTFGNRGGYPRLTVLDTTHPEAIQDTSSQMNLERTAFIVATKSGTTVETLSLFRFFYNQLVKLVGKESAGRHFIAITDPESALVEIAERYGFHKTFLNDANIGGRYSALSYFGLVPAALIGIDIDKLLAHALRMRKSIQPESDIFANEAAVLGTIIGTLANAGRDKLTLISSSKIDPIGDWIEQLIAESTGKLGKGILPVVSEQVAEPDMYGEDRLFVHLCWKDDDSYEPQVEELFNAGHPIVKIEIEELEAFGALFFLWELATAVAGYWLGINPFDQPNVEAAKIRAKEMVRTYRETGALPAEKPVLTSATAELYAGAPGASKSKYEYIGQSINASLGEFIRSGAENAYISIQAYLPPSLELTRALRDFQAAVRDHTGLAVTLGYGPRFLHSTGQLHKGDAGHGLFIQLTDVKNVHINIPDEPGSEESSITFNTLIDSQALGDRRALLDAGRSVIRIHILEAVTENIQAFRESIDAI
jgi:glucose-6-phosphate isomerase